MSYQAFEVKQGGALSRVQSICRHLTQGGAFTETTPITLSEVELFLDDAYYMLLGELAKQGYATTIASTLTNVLAVLEQIQAYDAAASVEMAAPAGEDAEDNKRWQGLVARRKSLIENYIRGDTLQQLGATRSRNRSQYLQGAGRSIDRKNTVYEDTDIVPSRFPRDLGSRRPRTTTLAQQANVDND